MKSFITGGILLTVSLSAEVVKSTYADGTVKSEKNVVSGKREGMAKSYYKSGKIKSETPFKNDKRDGLAKGYYENGTLKYEKPYKLGALNGQSRTYYKNGKLRSDFTFENDLPVKGNKYLPDGQKIKNK